MTKDKCIQAIINKWTDSECLEFLKTLSNDSLKHICKTELEFQFSDCKTSRDFKEHANMRWLKNPKATYKIGG